MLQVTEEPNLTISLIIDGSFPNVREALVKGAIAAKKEAKSCGYEHIQVVFSAVSSFDHNDDFWKAIGEQGGIELINSLDYVGLDFYPDVLYPLAPDGLPGDIRHGVEYMLRMFRVFWIGQTGIQASMPMHVSENG